MQGKLCMLYWILFIEENSTGLLFLFHNQSQWFFLHVWVSLYFSIVLFFIYWIFHFLFIKKRWLINSYFFSFGITFLTFNTDLLWDFVSVIRKKKKKGSVSSEKRKPPGGKQLFFLLEISLFFNTGFSELVNTIVKSRPEISVRNYSLLFSARF